MWSLAVTSDYWCDLLLLFRSISKLKFWGIKIMMLITLPLKVLWFKKIYIISNQLTRQVGKALFLFGQCGYTRNSEKLRDLAQKIELSHVRVKPKTTDEIFMQMYYKNIVSFDNTQLVTFRTFGKLFTGKCLN